jgi:hypothetical protein
MKKIFAVLSIVLLFGAFILLFSINSTEGQENMRKVHKTWGLECRKVPQPPNSIYRNAFEQMENSVASFPKDAAVM